MTKSELKNNLTKKYSTENWKEILQFIFPNLSLFTVPQEIQLPIDSLRIQYSIPLNNSLKVGLGRLNCLLVLYSSKGE